MACPRGKPRGIIKIEDSKNMNITAAMVKELRELTGAGMMECKKALVESHGDLEAAVVAMRKSGQAKAAKRAGRIAAEGAIALLLDQAQKTGFIVEINCETDFVARSEQFKSFVAEVVARGLELQATDEHVLLSSPINAESGQTIDQVRHSLIAKVGENINIRRAVTIKSNGVIGGYLHGDRIGVLVALDKFESELAKDLGMHIAATNPLAIKSADLSESIIQKEREIFIAQAKESGKPDHIIEKMVEGRIDKFLQENCLINQPFVKNPEQTIGNLLQSKQTQVISFVRYEVGEGIEKKELDFAEEVKAQIQENN